MTQHPVFQRIEAPNYTPVPDYFLDEVLAKLKSAAQIQIYLFICRQTFGWKKATENLSLSYIAKGLGLKRNTVVKATAALCKMQLVLRCQNKTAEGIHARSTYSLNMTSSPIKHRATLDDENHLGGRGLQSPRGRGLQSPQSKTDKNKDNNNKGVVAAMISAQDTSRSTSTQTITAATSPHFGSQTSSLSGSETAIATLLRKQGIGRGVAQQLARQFDAAYVKAKISYLANQLAQNPKSIKNPKGWLRKAIEEDYGAPDGYQSPEEKAQTCAQEQQLSKQRQQIEQLEQQALVRQRQATRKQIQALQVAHGTTDVEARLWDAIKAQLTKAFPGSLQVKLVAETCYLLAEEGGVIQFATANRMAKEWLMGRFAPVIKAQLKQKGIADEIACMYLNPQIMADI